MTKAEKQKLQTLFGTRARWCQGSEAMDVHGEPVNHDDPDATSWDIVGGLCHAFGWERAQALFPEIHAHFRTGASPGDHVQSSFDAMRDMSDLNDADGTTYETLAALIDTLPTTVDAQIVAEASPDGSSEPSVSGSN